MDSRILKGDLLTTHGQCFVSQVTASNARKWRVPKVSNLVLPSDYVPIEIKPNGFVLRHKLSVDLSQASVTPSYAGQSLSFDVYGHIAEWPFISCWRVVLNITML